MNEGGKAGRGNEKGREERKKNVMELKREMRLKRRRLGRIEENDNNRSNNNK